MTSFAVTLEAAGSADGGEQRTFTVEALGRVSAVLAAREAWARETGIVTFTRIVKIERA